MKHLEKHHHMFEVLKKASPKLRKAILRNADDDLICILAEIIVNLMDRNIEIRPQQKRKLARFKNIFRRIARHCSHTPNKRKLRKQIVQSGGALPFLIPLIAKAALAGAVSSGIGIATKKILDK